MLYFIIWIFIFSNKETFHHEMFLETRIREKCSTKLTHLTLCYGTCQGYMCSNASAEKLKRENCFVFFYQTVIFPCMNKYPTNIHTLY